MIFTKPLKTGRRAGRPSINVKQSRLEILRNWRVKYASILHWATSGTKMSCASLIVRIQEFRDCRSGVTAIEYGLIAGSIGIVTAVAFNTIGNILQTNYYDILAGFF